MSTRTVFPVTSLLVAIAISACSAGATDGTQSSPGAGASQTPTVVAGIDHPTGLDEIVLRLDEGGGFVPVEYVAAHVPQFTLYGDGTVVFTSASAAPAERADGVVASPPLRTAKLTEEQVQALLEAAIRDGGLGVARAEYQNPLVADAPTAVFTLNADGASRTVSVVALGMEDSQPNADTAIKQALAELGNRLKDFDNGGTLASEAFVPVAYQGTLTKQQGGEGVQVRDWPWTDLTPADFAIPSGADQLPQGHATLTPAQAGALGIDGYESGLVGGVYLRDDAGTVYSLVLRPLLPDEPSAS
jgi:hypothetical protein